MVGASYFALARGSSCEDAMLVAEQIQQIEKARLEQLKKAPKAGPNLMILILMRVVGIGIETADMLVKEILSRNLRDRRAVARYGENRRGCR